MTVHYATREVTACGCHIFGNTVTYHGDRTWDSDTENVNHTTLIEKVNCISCKYSDDYKKAEKAEKGS